MPIHVVLLPRLFLGVALISLLVVITPTTSPVVPSQTIFFIIVVLTPALVVLTHILVEEVIRERSLISYVLHFSLCDVALAVVAEPIARSGFLCVFAMREAALISILTRVVPRSHHVDVEQVSWLAPPRVHIFRHVDGVCR